MANQWQHYKELAAHDQNRAENMHLLQMAFDLIGAYINNQWDVEDAEILEVLHTIRDIHTELNA